METIARLGALRDRYVFRQILRLHKGFLNLFTYKVEGCPHDVEMLWRDDAVVVVPIDWRDRTVVMVRQPRLNRAFVDDPTAQERLREALRDEVSTSDFEVPAEHVVTLESPAGMVDKGETPEAAAVRELLEETGYQAGPEALEKVVSVLPSIGGSAERVHLYFADLSKATYCGAPKGDGSENIEVVRLSWDEAYGLVSNGGITSSSSNIMFRELRIRELSRR